MAMNQLLLRNSWTRRLVSTLSPPRSHLITLAHSYRGYCSDSSSGINSNNSELEELCSSKQGLVRCSANHAPLSPIGFLERAAKAYRDRTSVIYGSLKYTWAQTHQRCLKLASALTQLGISRGDVVATLAPNVPAMYELHFAAPMAGAVLCTLNSRLDSAMISVLLSHSEAKIVFVDHQLLGIVDGALALLAEKAVSKPPLVVLIADSDGSSSPNSSTTSETKPAYEYESLLESGNSGFEIRRPKSEWDPISVNYTSGTTSRPKGVVYSHRGAYLNSLATVLLHGIGSMPVYLWTVPMFHCNGWCLIWGLAAQGGTNICLRKVTPKGIFDNIALHNVTHMGGAPTVLNMIVNSPVSDQRPLPHKVEVMTGGSPPPPQILFKMEEMGFGVNHLYGLTETYGPGTYCSWKPEWDSLPSDQRSKLKARQGVQHVGLEEVDIKDPVTMESVPPDGKTMGEIMFRGNTVMSGYLKDSRATEEAFKGGWFRSGDLAVKHPDNYIEVKDRLKDVIISGGENISTVEVETVLFSHPAVLEAAVVARPDNHWGQTPCAFVKLKDGFDVNAQELIEFCRNHMPHYMAPRTVIFDDIPKTSTGKIQKFILREKAKVLGSLS
ncbi:putative 4-coumarate--CoA ligase [Rosa chinensis]|uniref:Putative 4-coumarate--CoA ligase n=1 Tax=Rosa chinensis TaxID=74649 RepID=A0A2P6PQ38_ROSCH|nr:probable acyl-activating enzyme 2 [Rosa chinensis]XP_040364959.1 probable acyl-activating enzyme 2 [Rosa chinensis]PRQ24040.1 putative 4-coumarate--CoA ligase [Rosa chinensis]